MIDDNNAPEALTITPMAEELGGSFEDGYGDEALDAADLSEEAEIHRTAAEAAAKEMAECHAKFLKKPFGLYSESIIEIREPTKQVARSGDLETLQTPSSGYTLRVVPKLPEQLPMRFVPDPKAVGLVDVKVAGRVRSVVIAGNGGAAERMNQHPRKTAATAESKPVESDIERERRLDAEFVARMSGKKGPTTPHRATPKVTHEQPNIGVRRQGLDPFAHMASALMTRQIKFNGCDTNPREPISRVNRCLKISRLVADTVKVGDERTAYAKFQETVESHTSSVMSEAMVQRPDLFDTTSATEFTPMDGEALWDRLGMTHEQYMLFAIGGTSLQMMAGLALRPSPMDMRQHESAAETQLIIRHAQEQSQSVRMTM